MHLQKATIHYLRTQRPAKQHKRRHQRDTRDKTKACSKSKDKTFKRGFANKGQKHCALRAEVLHIKSNMQAYLTTALNSRTQQTKSIVIQTTKKGNTESKYSKQHHPKHRMQYTSTADNNARPQKRQYTSTISCKSLTKVEVW